MALQVEQGNLALETSFSTGGLQVGQVSLVYEMNIPVVGMNVEQCYLIFEVGAAYSQVILTGQFTDCLGVPLSYGTIDLQLSGNTAYSIGAQQIIPGSQRIYLDAEGNIPAGTALYSNAVLSPSGSYYRVSGQTNSGRPFFKGAYYTMVVPSTLASQNIANLLAYPN